MNKSLLYQAIENPAMLGNIPLEDLEKLREEYPWFSAAQVLLAKAYQIRDDHRFTDQLRHASLFSADRRQLYDYMRPIDSTAPHENQNTTPEVIATPSDSELLEKKPVKEAVSVTEPVSAETTASDESVFFDIFAKRSGEPHTKEEYSPRPSESKSEDQHSQPAAELIKSEEILDDSAGIEGPFPSPEDNQPLPGLHEADSPGLLEDQDTETDRPPIQFDTRLMDPLEREILAEAVSSSIEQEVGEPSEEEPGSTESDLIPPSGSGYHEDSISPDYDIYTAWLLRRSREIHYEEPGIAGSSGDGKKVTESADISSMPPIRQVPKPLNPPDKKSQQRDLIDRFMKLDPKITPGKSAEYDTQNIAKESLEEDNDLVTETMARLFAAQGRLDKARKAYRRLMELHPEKSVYFATQLKNLSSTKKG